MDTFWNLLMLSLLCLGNLSIVRGMKLHEWLDEHKENPEKQDFGVVTDISSTNCFATQQKFVELGIGEASLTINKRTHDADMLICYNGRVDARDSCCTPTMERLYQTSAVREYHEILHTSSSYLRNLLIHNANHYQELFLGLISEAHNNTERLFSEVYHLPPIDRWGLSESLFLDLQAYLRQKDVSIHKSIETFFDQLFPLVFHNNINDPQTSEFSTEFRNCLVESRRSVYPPPFGGIPSKIAHQLAHSFSSARAFLDTLRMGIKVINTTTDMPLSQSCQAALTRLEYCGQCQGHVDVSPCRGFCYNVMRGCFAHITDLNVHWNEMIDALEMLTVNMRGANDIEEVLHSFHAKISEAIMHAMETAVKFNNKVVQRCGHPKSTASLQENVPSRITPKPDVSAIMPTPLGGGTRLYTKIEMFMRNVIAAKGFLSHLPDTMCTSERYSAGIDVPCWNGESVDSYNKSIMMKDLSAQKQNPEVKVKDEPEKSIAELISNMEVLKKILNKKLSLDVMQGDTPSIPVHDDPSAYYYGNNQEAYGSGDPYYRKSNYNPSGYNNYGGHDIVDDEDWGGSGSASGYDYSQSPIRTVSRKPDGHTPNTDDITFVDPSKSIYVTKQPMPPVSSDTYRAATAAITTKLNIVLMTICTICLGFLAAI